MKFLNRFALLSMLLAQQLTHAQSLSSVTLEPARAVPAVSSSPLTKSAQMTEARRKFVESTSRIREHHRPVPLPRTARPFASLMSQENATVVKRGDPISFPNSVKVLGQKSLDQSTGLKYDHASPVGEPTLAVRGDEILVTGNWYAALSLDGGSSFAAIEPMRLFAEDPAGGGFCCDQVALFDPTEDAFFWLLQGRRGAEGNTYRLVMAKGRDDIRKQAWRYIDIRSNNITGNNSVWMDFPSMSVSRNFVYLTANLFNGDLWVGASVMRVPKTAALNGQGPQVNTWTNTNIGSLRLVEGGGETMYWAGHKSTGDIAIWSWNDGDAQPSNEKVIDIEPWSVDIVDDADKQAPNGRQWLKRLDGRLGAAWMANGRIGFAWTAREDNRFPLPHVRVALVNESDVRSAGVLSPVRPVAEPHIWSKDFAIGYPAISGAADGGIAATVTIGGKTLYPSTAVGTLAGNNGLAKWGFAIPTKGLNTPACPKQDGTIDRECGVWGDYFAIRPNPKRAGSWSTVGYTVRSTDAEGARLRVEPEYVWFAGSSEVFNP